MAGLVLALWRGETMAPADCIRAPAEGVMAALTCDTVMAGRPVAFPGWT